MLYPYECEPCKYQFDVIKSMNDSSRLECCEKCGKEASRSYSSFSFYGADDWNKQEYNPALGKVVYSKAHKRKILADFKAQGKEMIEIGNEPLEKIHSHFEKRQEEKRLQRWADADRMKE